MRHPLHLLSCLAIVSCASQTSSHPPQAATNQPTTPVAKAAAPAPEPTSCRADADCSASELCVHAQCVGISANLAECQSFQVHFAYDSANLPTGINDQLERMSRCLKADESLHVTIDGNADERGTEEYNLALGQRRADTVAQQLKLLGASGDQLKSVTYGKERPICQAHNEACWAKNRRDEIKVSSR